MAVVASTADAPDEVYAVDTGRRSAGSVHQNDAWLASVRLAPVEEISVRSKDGTEINGFMVKPPDYRRAGAIRPCSGSMAARSGSSTTSSPTWSGRCWPRRGYVVIAANPRGSSGRGERFASAIWADWGHKDAEDVLAAVDYAVRAGIADPGAARRGRLELRRHPDRLRHRPGSPIQGRDQRRGASRTFSPATAPTSTSANTRPSWACPGSARRPGSRCRSPSCMPTGS